MSRGRLFRSRKNGFVIICSNAAAAADRKFSHPPHVKQEAAKRLIIREWDRWVRRRPIDSTGAPGRDSLKFFLELQDARSPLLDFQTRSRDKWQVVHAWLLEARRVH
jgi:hypothetical protein